MNQTCRVFLLASSACAMIKRIHEIIEAFPSKSMTLAAPGIGLPLGLVLRLYEGKAPPSWSGSSLSCPR